MKAMHVFVKSYGCSANLADGEFLKGCLAKAGYKLARSAPIADVLIYNTCAVKGPTENRVIEALKRAPRDKKLIVAGCLPLINFERLRREVRFDGAVGPAFGDEIVDVVRRVVEGEKVVALEDALTAKPRLSLPQLRSNPVVSVLPVSYGCLGSCAYCCVVFARGRLRSYNITAIIERVRKDLAAGAKEFWVTSQDTACYGRDIGTNLAALLKALCVVEGDFQVRVGMMTPNLVTAILDDLIEAFKSRKVFKFLHLPVQSGDDNVLKLMNRRYTVEDFKEIVHAFREEIPRITLSTDVICGFPGESIEAFEQTKNLIGEVQPDIVNVSKFFSRPNTPAEKLSPLPPKEVNRRSREMSELSKKISFEKNRAWMNWEGTALFEERGREGSWMGRNFAYKPIVVKAGESLLGKFVRVRVVDAFSTYLEAEVVGGS